MEEERKKEVRGDRQPEGKERGRLKGTLEGGRRSSEQDTEQERRHRFNWREGEIEVKVEG